MKEENKMHILDLEIENIKRIKVARIKPDGNMVVIEGENSMGKTSILDSIMYLLGGKKAIPDNPIRTGETKAKIQGKIGKYTISRKWTNKDTSYLKIVNEDGFTPPKPQDFLDDLVGDLTFDPMAFVTKDKKKRKEILREITGLDLSKQDSIIAESKDQRKLINRDIDKAKKELENYQDIKVPNSMRSMSEINADIEKATNNNNEIGELENTIQENAESIDEYIIRNKAIKSEIVELENEYSSNSKDGSVIAKSNKDNKDLLESKTLIDCTDFEKELNQVEKNSEIKFRLDRKKSLEEELIEIIKKQKAEQAKIDNAEKEKVDKLESTKMPIDGLAFGDDDVLFEGNSFDEISQARKIEVSMAMSFAENPKLRICRIKDGSLLDKKSFQKIHDLSVKNDFQCWVERVADKKSGNTIYVEDGEIK